MQTDDIGGFVEDGSPVIGTVTGFSRGTMPDTHAHRRGQLAWCPDRPVTVETGRALHLVSPGMAIWLPPDCPHRIRAGGARQSVNLYALPGHAPLPDHPAPFALGSLEREVLRTLAGAPRSDRREPAFARLTAVLWDRLARPAGAPGLPLPADPRLRRIALTHLDGAEQPLDRWAEALGLSRRSLQRLVARDTGRNWATWMRALRLARALAPLMAGASVQTAAHAAGYATASGFVAAFHAAYGITPGQMQRRMGV
ncbi:helix-turn-helix domain-containing protein [Celeribacter indicus]|uniref:AraC family transcriptional regulator n=1 Tax=Celeribacter indicus TaxID=1208324 RepID=A0A0B5E235_9RHOB|nr:helix-turn-helix domain-containing protein [Celeribacter indicus]AJE47111.1 AraC family transcriptional regulator [Celeribacter indicus]SDW90566.1 AraC-type DNA-binding protein [Celeribacter indicus]